MFFKFLMYTTCYISHTLFPLCLIILVIFCDSYKLSSSSIMHFSPPSCHFLPCRPNVSLSTHFPNTLGLLEDDGTTNLSNNRNHSPSNKVSHSVKTWIFTPGLLTVKDKVPYPHKAMGNTRIIQI